MDWSFPESALYESPDLSGYWKSDYYPFIIRIDGELAGYLIVNKKGTTSQIILNNEVQVGDATRVNVRNSTWVISLLAPI